MIIGILTAIIMVLWILPAYLKTPKDYRLDKKFIIKTILMGLVVGFIGAFILQIIAGAIFANVLKIPQDSLLYEFLKAFIMFGIIEELMKFSAGSFSLKKSKFQSKFDYMIIFALAAFGFTLLETTMASSGGLAGIFRAFFPFHIMWQIFMAAHLYEYKVAKMNNDSKTMKKELAIAFAVPILMHGCCDFSTVLIGNALSSIQSTMGTLDIISLILPLIYMVSLIIFTIITEIRFYRYCKNL
jgi:RsiW-degrading membrane proteinase PrsW (M82 family)